MLIFTSQNAVRLANKNNALKNKIIGKKSFCVGQKTRELLEKFGFKVIQMRENADAAMFSSLLWTTTVFSAIFAVATGYENYMELEATSNSSVVWISVVQSALAWIVIAFLTSTAGFMLLRLKKGSFSGRLIVLAVFGMVVYSVLDQGLGIARDVLTGAGYEFSVQQIWEDMLEPLMWIAVLWVTTTIVRAVQTRQAQADRYWGI